MRSVISGGGVPQRRPLLRVDANDERQMLVDAEHGVRYELNPTALALWELCDGATRVAEMVEGVCELFAVSPERAEADVYRTLDEFGRVGLIDWAAPGHLEDVEDRARRKRATAEPRHD